VGFGCAVVFLFLGAPDVAFTQLAVEVAFVVVIAAVLVRVRRLDLAAPVRERAWPRVPLALATGTLVAVLVVVAAAPPFDTALQDFFAARSVPDAHGRNVVNVILVDFRAVDTLGEITVVATGFLGALPLIALVRDRLRRGGARP
jgi:multicomponent Na+:H+ antiporter subunit A